MDCPTRDFFSTDIIQSTNFNDKDCDTPRRDLRQLVEYVVGLKAERRKIEAFKRELPLCLDLLNDAVEMFEVVLRKGRGGVECNLSEVGGLNLENNDVEDMKNWMSSAQLWNYHDHNDSHRLKSLTGKVGNNAKEQKWSAMEISKRSDDQLSLKNPVVAPTVKLSHSSGENVALNKANVLVNKQTVQKKFQRQCWSQQKQRRCWSHELHQRFVDALQQLGGSEVATPKQIRDIMRVKGLTNEEVKSHLQKYRLQVRKASSHSPLSPSSSSPSASQDDDLHPVKLKNKSHSVSPLGHLDVSAGSVRCSVSNNTTLMDEADEEEIESHSWRNHSRVIYRPTMPTC